MSRGMLPKTSPLLLCAGLLLAGCGGARGSAQIDLYSGQHEQTTAKLVSAFEKRTGITVEIRSADEATLGNQILQEGANSPADVFYAENTPVLEALEEKGLLSPVRPSTLAAIPPRFNSAAGRWVGVSARVSVLVYNTRMARASELPGSILELSQPRWKGRLAFAPSETDFQPLITSITRLDGAAAAESWLKGLQANSTVYPDNETVVAQVNSGQSAIGLIDHYYWYRLRSEVGAGEMHSALHYYAPGDPGNLVDVSGAGILRSSPHQAEAQALLAFMVSPEGQSTIAHSDSYEYPLRPGVAAAAGLPPLAKMKPAPLTPAQLGDGSGPLKLEQAIGLL